MMPWKVSASKAASDIMWTVLLVGLDPKMLTDVLRVSVHVGNFVANNKRYLCGELL